MEVEQGQAKKNLGRRRREKRFPAPQLEGIECPYHVQWAGHAVVKRTARGISPRGGPERKLAPLGGTVTCGVAGSCGVRTHLGGNAGSLAVAVKGFRRSI